MNISLTAILCQTQDHGCFLSFWDDERASIGLDDLICTSLSDVSLCCVTYQQPQVRLYIAIIQATKERKLTSYIYTSSMIPSTTLLVTNSSKSTPWGEAILPPHRRKCIHKSRECISRREGYKNAFTAVCSELWEDDKARWGFATFSYTPSTPFFNN